MIGYAFRARSQGEELRADFGRAFAVGHSRDVALGHFVCCKVHAFLYAERGGERVAVPVGVGFANVFVELGYKLSSAAFSLSAYSIMFSA